MSDIEARAKVDDVLDRHWWPQFGNSNGGFFTHYCRACQLRYTREGFKSHLRDELIRALSDREVS